MIYRHIAYMCNDTYAFIDIRGVYDKRFSIYRKDLSGADAIAYDNYMDFINMLGGKLMEVNNIDIPADLCVDIYGDFTLNEAHTSDVNYRQVFDASELDTQAIKNFFSMVAAKCI